MFIVKTADGDVVKWKDGEYLSQNEELVAYIRERGKQLSQNGIGVVLDGSIISAKGADYEKSEYTAYALLGMCVKISAAKGEIPNAEKLWGKTKENAVT